MFMLLSSTSPHQVTNVPAPLHQQATDGDARAEQPQQQKRKAPRNADARAVKRHDTAAADTHAHAMPIAAQQAVTRTVPADDQHMAPLATTHTHDICVPQLSAAQPQDVPHTTTNSQPKHKKVRKKLDFDGKGRHGLKEQAKRQPENVTVDTLDHGQSAHGAHAQGSAASPPAHDTAARTQHDVDPAPAPSSQQHQSSPPQPSPPDRNTPVATDPLGESTTHNLLAPSTTAPALSGEAANVEEGGAAVTLEEGLEEDSHILDRPPRSTPAQKLERRKKRKEQLRYGRVLVELLVQ